MTRPDFEGLLQRTMGLGAATIGSAAVERAVRTRMAACSDETHDVYWARLQTLESEVQELIEAVVVSETWFFRDREAFAAMVSLLAKDEPKAQASEPLRLLSVPCATGEEPYSMAMAMLDAGFPPARFQVDAVDISLRALERARVGFYGRNSFRGDDLSFRDRHFTAAERDSRLSDAVRARVRFAKGNILDAGFSVGGAPYDIIFCRNLLIYFGAAEQDGAIAALRRLLKLNGLLFVGPSETTLLLNRSFTPVRFPLAFAFRKESAEARPAGVAPKASLRVPQPTLRAAMPPPPPKRAEPKKAEPKPDMEQIRRLADEGHLAEAARACEEQIRLCGASATALYLLGLIRDSTGSYQDAADCYRKAIYLDPQHTEALAHLSFLLEKQGDLAGAKILHGRLARLRA